MHLSAFGTGRLPRLKAGKKHVWREAEKDTGKARLDAEAVSGKDRAPRKHALANPNEYVESILYRAKGLSRKG